MSQASLRYGVVLLAVLVGTIGLALAYRRSKTRASNLSRPRSVLDYLLIWPLLFESSSNVDRSKQLLTTREIVGWLVVAALMIFVVAFS